MRQRNARIRRDAERRRNARHDFKRNTGAGKRLGLLAAAPEDERVAAFQPDHVEPAFTAVNQQRADFFLRQRVRRFLLADVDPLGGSGREVEQNRVGQMVVKNGVRLGKKAFGFEGDEFRIAWSRADQINLAHREPGRSSKACAPRFSSTCATLRPSSAGFVHSPVAV